jgi:hypothetical protein
VSASEGDPMGAAAEIELANLNQLEQFCQWSIG